MKTPNDPAPPQPPAMLDGFAVLDDCHRETLVALDKLDALVTQLDAGGADDQARKLAAEIIGHFSIVARQHHADEELHVFPKMAASGDAELVQAVLRLQQDHHWLEEDWHELSPHVDAVACGQNWYDVAVLREAVTIFVALSRDHMALEESLLYPQARALIGPGERRQMGREMAARRRAQRKPARGPT